MSDIQVVSQKVVTLYGDELLAVKAEDDQVYVSIRWRVLSTAANTNRRTQND